MEIWSTLPLDILRSVFERLSVVDFHRAKMVCSNWYSVSKQTVPRKSGSPLLLLLPDDGGCVLYNPCEDMVYRTKRDFSGSRSLASCGKWFLMLDSRSRLYIINVFSGNRTDLPPLDSVVTENSALKRVEDRDREFEWEFTDDDDVILLYADEIRGRLWVDEKTEEFALAWFFDAPAWFVCFYKKGNDHYDFISVCFGIPKLLRGLMDLVLWGYRLYIVTDRRVVRVIDFSGQQGFEEISGSEPTPTFSPFGYDCDINFAVKTTGEVLLVTSKTSESSEWTFHIYKKDPDTDPNDYIPDVLEVDSLGDEALLLDLGITVPANHTLGIKPNSIYFTRHESIRIRGEWSQRHVLPAYEADIGVFDLSTKTLEPFPAPSNMNLNDARWIFSMT